jgi:hypothetical protein
MKEFHVTFYDLDWGGCDRKPRVAWGGYKIGAIKRCSQQCPIAYDKKGWVNPSFT